jgi:glycosyltransferase involved in cell wall biosynthesis
MLEIALALTKEHDVSLLTTGTIDRAAVERFLGKSVGDISVVSFRQHPSMIARLLDRVLAGRREGNVYKKMFTSIYGPQLVKHFDLFINGESGDFIRNTARRGIFMIFFPWADAKKWNRSGLFWQLYRLPYRVWRRYCYRAAWDTYKQLYAISHYSRAFVETWLGRRCGVLYPPIDGSFVPRAKKRRVVMLGRFMPGDGKGHLFAIEQFKRISGELAGWELICAGSLWPGKPYMAYFRQLEAAAAGAAVALLPNISFDDLVTIVGEARILWHAMGYGKDLRANPELAEHFGMPTVESMRAGCVPIAFRAGGQPEIVDEGVNGFLWTEPSELTARTRQLASDENLWQQMSTAAIARSAAFSRANFQQQLATAVSDLIGE